MSKIGISGASVSFASHLVLDRIDLEIEAGEIVCLIGASGCGKSTLLNVIAGLVPAEGGSVTIDGRPIRGPGADRVMVFQDDAVFPWMTVGQNVEFGLKAAGVPAAGRRRIAAEKLALVELAGQEGAFPRELSGGMRKRVDLARALAVSPEVILMDEPYGALDAMTKERLQLQFLSLCETTRATSVFVTHDLEEALFLGDRVVVMGRNPGRVDRTIDVPFAHPRPIELKRTAEFQSLRGKLSSLIH